MMQRSFIHTSESFTAGHPDKLCDRISDAIVDAFLDADPLARVGAECVLANGVAFLAARFATNAIVDLPSIVREEVAAVYPRAEDLTPETLSVLTNYATLPQSLRLHGLDDDASSRPAGQLVTAFGYATDETPEMMPMPIWLAHRTARSLMEASRGAVIPGLSPDATVQVAIRYEGRQAVAVDAVTVQVAGASVNQGDQAAFQDAVRELAVVPAMNDLSISPPPLRSIQINPEGAPEPGGPQRHTGLTGRKLAADTYGGFARHAGSGLSGKDPWRVDRTASYAARRAAKLAVAAGLASRCEVQVSYRSDSTEPSSLQVETFGTGRLDEATLSGRLREVLDWRPVAIARDLNLVGAKRTRLRSLAAYGQVGQPASSAVWEDTSMASALRG